MPQNRKPQRGGVYASATIGILLLIGIIYLIQYGRATAVVSSSESRATTSPSVSSVASPTLRDSAASYTTASPLGSSSSSATLTAPPDSHTDNSSTSNSPSISSTTTSLSTRSETTLSIGLSQSSGLAGDSITVTGGGFTPGSISWLTSSYGNEQLFTVGPAGTFSQRYTVPLDAPTGPMAITAVDGTTQRSTSAQFTISGSGTATTVFA